MDKEAMVLEDFVDELLDSPNVPEEIIEKGSEYQQLTIRARRVMQQKYKVLENMMSFKSSASVFALPGNYDMDLKYTSLHERDLHLHWHNIGGLKIAGYGGADVWTAGIPERYIVRYEGGIGTSDRNNEMWNFFKAVKPDIIAAHQPAHGIHDRIARIGPSGSPSLRTFCENNPVKLCLTGHVHNDWGFRAVEGCVYLNPSNFGEVTTVQGEVSEGGFFYQIEFNETDMEKIIAEEARGRPDPRHRRALLHRREMAGGHHRPRAIQRPPAGRELRHEDQEVPPHPRDRAVQGDQELFPPVPDPGDRGAAGRAGARGGAVKGQVRRHRHGHRRLGEHGHLAGELGHRHRALRQVRPQLPGHVRAVRLLQAAPAPFSRTSSATSTSSRSSTASTSTWWSRASSPRTTSAR